MAVPDLPVMCGEVYLRPEEVAGDGTRAVLCTRLDHLATQQHSWVDLKEADLAYLEEMTRPRLSVDQVLTAVKKGDLDPFVESLLAALHGRKREKRGIYAPHGLTKDHDYHAGRRTS